MLLGISERITPRACQVQLTGALGLIITLGGSDPCRVGVPGPPALGELPLMALNLSGATTFEVLSELTDPACV